MFFSFLPIFSHSIWWEFNETEFPIYEEDSLRHPIFAVCTSTYCPHCKGLPEMLHSYADMLDNNSPVIFTNINCQKSTVCGKIGVKGVPTFVLIRSTKAKNWIQTYERNIIGWSNFLKTQLRSEIHRIDSDFELSPLVDKTYNGGSTFFLKIGSKDVNTDILTTFRKQAALYSAVKCTFAYKNEGESSQLIIYSSSHCHTTVDVNSESLEKIIQNNLNSKFYHFDSNELYDTIHQNKTTMIFVGDKYEEPMQKQIIDIISRKHCDDIVFGWANKKTDYPIVKFGGRSKEDGKFYFIVNPKKNCFSSKDGGEVNDNFESFIEMSTVKPQCKRIPVLRRAGKKKPLKKVWIYLAIGTIAALFGSYFIYQIFSGDTLKLE